MSRADAIKNYLQAGKSVCPFARACPLELATVSTNPRADRAVILRSVTAFAAARGNAIVLLAEADKDYAATAAWATEAFLELMICCEQVSQPLVPIEAVLARRAEIEDYVERIIRPTLSSPEIRPHIALHDKALMTICMAPVYPADHPRHAPHTILVATWSDDIGAVLGTGASPPKIREAMAKAHGHVYDANELMLPLPTVASPRAPLDPTRKVSEGGHPDHRLALGIDCPEIHCRSPKGEWCPMAGTTWNLCGKRIDVARGHDGSGGKL